jgi:cytoskeletal protein CcmA (bactofilin family)
MLRLALLANLVVLLFLAPVAAHAADIRQGSDVVVAAGETIDDDLIAAGQTVTIAGHVTGDVYTGAQTVLVSGTVDGDLIGGAQTVTIDGTIRGSVRAAGQQVTINGTVGRNVSDFGQRILVNSSGRVNGSVLGAAQELAVLGPVARGVTFSGGSLQLAAPVGGNVTARVQDLSVAPTAHVAGALDYRAEHEAALPPGAVAGPVTYAPAEPAGAPATAPLNGLFDPGSLIWLIGSALLGAVVLAVIPRASWRGVDIGRRAPLPTFGIGVAALILTPIVAVILAITIIGLPVTLALLAAYAFGVLVAWPVFGVLVGMLVSLAARRDRTWPMLGALVIGLLLLHVLTHIPFLGGLVTFVGLSFGLGMVVQSLRIWRESAAQPAEVAPYESTPVRAAA